MLDGQHPKLCCDSLPGFPRVAAKPLDRGSVRGIIPKSFNEDPISSTVLNEIVERSLSNSKKASDDLRLIATDGLPPVTFGKVSTNVIGKDFSGSLFRKLPFFVILEQLNNVNTKRQQIRPFIQVTFKLVNLNLRREF